MSRTWSNFILLRLLDDSSALLASVRDGEGDAGVIRRLLVHVLDVTSDALALTHYEDGTFVHGNATFCGVTGFGRDELLERSVLTVGIWRDPGERGEWAHNTPRPAAGES